jgi:hypothetical protein
MTSTTRGVRWYLLRALVAPLLVGVVVAGYFVVVHARAVSSTSEQLSESISPVRTTWKAGYSRRFPGCVAAVLWPAGRAPVAVVVRWGSGDVERVESRLALRRQLSRSPGDAEIIGACYSR